MNYYYLIIEESFNLIPEWYKKIIIQYNNHFKSLLFFKLVLLHEKFANHQELEKTLNTIEYE